MVSDSTRTIAGIIVVAMVLAATTPLFVGARVDGMSLRARDIGPWWQENGRGSPDYSHVGNSSFLENITFAEFAMMSNGTIIVTTGLFAFKSSEPINQFLDLFQNHSLFYDKVKKVNIGDQGYVYTYGADSYYGVIINGQEVHINSSNVVSLVFVEDNVLSSITVLVKGADTPAQPWIWDFIVDLGMIQLHKIDRYSSN